jgi:hypothetical protein
MKPGSMIRMAGMAVSLLLTASLMSSLHSQTLDWVLDGKTTNYNTAKAVANDNSGRLLLTGEIGNMSGLNTFEISNSPILTSRGLTDVYVASLDADGSVNWVQQIGGANFDVATDIAIDGGNNVYVCGLFDDSLWVGSRHLVSAGLTDVFMAKFDSSGALKWLKQIKSTGDHYYYPRIAADGAGNLYIGGAYSASCDFGDGILRSFQGGSLLPKDAYLAKYEPNGNTAWVKTWQSSSSEEVSSLAATPEGDVYVCGTFEDSLHIGGLKYLSAGKEDIFLLKLGTGGNIRWTKSFGGPASDMATSVATAGSQVLMALTFQQAIDIGATKFLHSQSAHNMVLSRFDSGGHAIWARSYPVEAFQLQADFNRKGQMCISGVFLISANFGAQNLVSSKIGKTDGFVALADSLGNISHVYQGLLSEDDEYIHGLAMDKSGNTYAAGVTFSPQLQWGSFWAAPGLFLLRIAQPDFSTSISTNEGSHDFRPFPNPSTDRLYWHTGTKVEHISIYDYTGKLLMDYDAVRGNWIDIGRLPSGCYLLKAKVNGSAMTSLVKKL